MPRSSSSNPDALHNPQPQAAAANRARPGRRNLNAKLAFLALKSPILDELATGEYVKTVYLRYADRLGVSYRQFCRYVSESKLSDATASRQSSAELLSLAAPSHIPSPPASRTPILTRSPSRGFVFDPTDIDEKKLI